MLVSTYASKHHMATCSEAIYATRRHFINLYSLFQINNYIEFVMNSGQHQLCCFIHN
jgi:hypothetical protein